MYRSALLSLLLALILSPLLGLAPAQSERRFGGTIPAPEFPPGLDWLNVSAPLSFAQLRGKIVLLDFWTYGCINCLHVIPELKLLEEKYAGRVGGDRGALGQVRHRAQHGQYPEYHRGAMNWNTRSSTIVSLRYGGATG